MEEQVQASGVRWAYVIGFEGLYRVSDTGVVHSCRSYKNIGFINTAGYVSAVLCKKSISKKWMVHRLVAEHFIDKVEGKVFINHKDGNKSNNHYSNLEWCNMLENNIHAYATGLKVLPKGKDDKRSQPIIQYDLNGNFIKEWAGAREAQRLGGFRQSNIWHCLVGNQHKSQGFIWRYKETSALQSA